MIANRLSGGLGWILRRRRARRNKAEYHRAFLEVLEPRLALSATLSPLADVNLLAGAPLNVAVHANDQNGEILYYDVSSSNPDVTPTLLDPYYNRSVRISVNYTGNPSTTSDDFSGDMVFQLFEEWAPNTTSRFTDLIDAGGQDGTPFYDGLTFHRIIQDFMIQGGDPSGDGTGGSGVKFDDEFASELQFTSSGILAMANSGSDTSDSQFFITSAPYRFGDFRYTIFGFLTSGDNVRQKIAAVPVDSNDKPLYSVQITSASVEIDDLDRVLHLSAPAGTTGSSTITVKAMTVTGDGHEQVVASQSFNVTVQADTNNNRPFLDATEPLLDGDDNPVESIDVVAGSQATFKINALDEESDAIYYGVTVDPSTTGITASVDSSTGVGTLTATSGAVGVKAVAIGVRKPTVDTSDSAVWDTQLVPVYVRPAAPAVSLSPDSDTGPSNSDGVTNLDNTAGKKLRFNVTGTVSGATVEVMADGVVIGTGTATGASIVIESDGDHTLSDGPHSITVRQTLYDQEVDVGNLQGTTDLVSDDSAAVNITVDTAGGIAITSIAPTTATEGSVYSYQVTTNETGTVDYSLTTAPTGMAINASTGLITWTPGGLGGSTVPVTVRASDLGGNATSQSFSIVVASVNVAPTATSQTVRLVSDTAVPVALAGNDGDPEVTQSLTFALATQPAHGTITNFNPATGTLTYTPNAGYVGTDSFTFTVTDDASAGEPVNLTSEPATVSLVVVVPNSQPTATPQTVSTSEGAARSITLTGDDGNADLVQTLTYAIVQQPLHGTLSGFNPQTGAVTYTPAVNYNGPDSFTFTVTDDAQGEPANLVSSPATVSINVTPVNAAPVATPASIAVNKDMPRLISLAGSDGDPDVVQTLTYTIVSGPSHGTLSGFDPATGQVTYTPAADYSGADSFTFTVTDDAAAGDPAGLTSAPATISLQVSTVNHQPTGSVQSVATDEDAPVGITLTGDDGDPGVQQSLTYAIASGPSHGTLSGFNPHTGEVRYTPAPNFHGTDSFTFTVTDDATAGEPASLTSGSVQVSITVNSVDDAPRFAAIDPQSVFQSGTLRTTVRADDVDTPANTIRYSLEPGSPEGVTIDSATGELVWNVPARFPTGQVSIHIRATEVNAQGAAGLSTVQAVGVSVQSLGAAVAGVLSPGPAFRAVQEAILPPVQAAAFLTAPNGGSALAGAALTGAQAVWFSADTMVTAPLAENVVGPDNAFGGGTVITAESDQTGPQGKAGDRSSPGAESQDGAPSRANKTENQAPAAKQTSRSATRSNDVALALLATESAAYAEASEEAAEAGDPAEAAEAAD